MFAGMIRCCLDDNDNIVITVRVAACPESLKNTTGMIQASALNISKIPYVTSNYANTNLVYSDGTSQQVDLNGNFYKQMVYTTHNEHIWPANFDDTPKEYTITITRCHEIQGLQLDEAQYHGANTVSYYVDVDGNPSMYNPTTGKKLVERPAADPIKVEFNGYFPYLQTFVSWACGNIEELDFTNCPNLTYIFDGGCWPGILKNINVSSCTKLQYLMIDHQPKLSSLDVTHNTELLYLQINGDNISELDLTNNKKLQYLNAASCAFSVLDLTNNKDLESVYCNNQKSGLQSINVTGLDKLKVLECYYNVLTKLDLSTNTALTRLWCYNNRLQDTLDLTNNKDLASLYVYYNYSLKHINIANCNKLLNIRAYNCGLLDLPLSEHPYLTELSCNYNRLDEIDISGCPKLTHFSCSHQYPEDTDDVIIQYSSRSKDYLKYISVKGLDGATLTCGNYQLGMIDGDYDLRNLTWGKNQSNGGGDLDLECNGAIKIKASINKKYSSEKDLGNDGCDAWVISADKGVTVYFGEEYDNLIIGPDYTLTGDAFTESMKNAKIAYYKKIADIIKTENLYNYLQICKICQPIFDLNTTRDLYDAHKVILYDSLQNNLWQNGRDAFGQVRPITQTLKDSAYFSWTPSVGWIIPSNQLVNVDKTYYHKLVVQPNATFYMTQECYWNHDYSNGKPRIDCKNGELTVSDGLNILSETHNDTDGTIEYVISFIRKGSSHYAPYYYIFESTYPDDESGDKYASKIISFTQTTVDELADE